MTSRKTTKNRNYARGANFERRAKLWFEAQGFLAVRSAGSRGDYDVVAADGKSVWWVQCKYQSTDESAAVLADKLVEKFNEQFPEIGHPIVIMVATRFRKGGKLASVLHGVARLLMPTGNEKHPTTKPEGDQAKGV